MVTQSLWPAILLSFKNNNAISFQGSIALIDARFSLVKAFVQKIKTSKLTHKSAVQIFASPVNSGQHHHLQSEKSIEFPESQLL
jgi:hypothetical protein